jgi:hypothetical protein
VKLTKKILKEAISKTIQESSMLIANPIDDKMIVQEGKYFYSLRRLDETTITGIQGKYMDNGFIVITSDRDCHAELGIPYGEPCPEYPEPGNAQEQEEKNIANRQELKDLVRSAGFGYTPVYGGYREEIKNAEGKVIGHVDAEDPEHSLLIMARGGNKELDSKALKDLGKELAGKFNQDSFFFKPPGEEDSNAYFIAPNGEVKQTFSDFVFGDLDQAYFTQLARGKQAHKPQKRFSAVSEGLYIPKPPLTGIEARRRRGEIFISYKRQLETK